jgi:hypothetical protein
MGSGVKKDAFANSGTANALSNQLTGSAANIYGGLEPELSTEAAHPMGMTPQAKAAANTAAQQSAGGSQAATVGQGGLYAARTRNAGAAQSAIGAGSRSAGANLSKAAVGTELANADLQNKQQQAGLSGLGSLYGTDIGEGENALGLSNQALGIVNQAGQNPWSKLAMGGLNNIVQAGLNSGEAAAGF